MVHSLQQAVKWKIRDFTQQILPLQEYFEGKIFIKIQKPGIMDIMRVYEQLIAKISVSFEEESWTPYKAPGAP